MSSPLLRASLLTLALSGCPREVPPPDHAAADAGVVAPELARAEALEREVEAVVRATDAHLWQHWVHGAPLDLSAARAGHEGLFTRDAVQALRHARELHPDASRRLAHVERWLLGELLARGVAAESEALAHLEAAASISLDGRELPWRDLNRLLAAEPSAVKRRALWAASHATALRLDAALARREAAAREVLASLDLPSLLDLEAEARELDLDALQAAATRVLADTEGPWREALQRLADVDVKLPVAKLTRADLPRLLRVPAAVDAEFDKAAVAPRLRQSLAGLHLEGPQGLTLELEDSPHKPPVPLLAAPAPGEVRVSVRPAAGLRALQHALAELGVGVALARAKTGAFATERLGDPACAQTWAERFARLPADPQWLAAAGVSEALRPAVSAAVQAQRLFLLRRAAGLVLARLETQPLTDEAAARARFVEVMARALGVAPAPEDGSRWRLETDDFGRVATQLKSLVRADGPWPTELAAALATGTAAPCPLP